MVRTVELARCSSQMAVLPVCQAAPVSARIRASTSRYSPGIDTAPAVTASTAVRTAVALSWSASAAATAAYTASADASWSEIWVSSRSLIGTVPTRHDADGNGSVACRRST